MYAGILVGSASTANTRSTGASITMLFSTVNMSGHRVEIRVRPRRRVPRLDQALAHREVARVHLVGRDELARPDRADRRRLRADHAEVLEVLDPLLHVTGEARQDAADAARAQ